MPIPTGVNSAIVRGQCHTSAVILAYCRRRLIPSLSCLFKWRDYYFCLSLCQNRYHWNFHNSCIVPPTQTGKSGSNVILLILKLKFLCQFCNIAGAIIRRNTMLHPLFITGFISPGLNFRSHIVSNHQIKKKIKKWNKLWRKKWKKNGNWTFE